jgi:hypothetical protein
MFRALRRAEVKAGPLIVLGLVAAGAIAFWVFRTKTAETPNNWVKNEDSFLLWCASCKLDMPIGGADAKVIAKQGEKLQCPKCKKFEGQWGRPAAVPSSSDGTTMMQP